MSTEKTTSALPTQTRQWVLASRPHGAPTPEDFRLETVDLPPLEDGQVLVTNDVMSVDPYMRGRMNDAKSYVAPFEVDAPLDGGAVGTVVASHSEDVPVGTRVLHQAGWRDHAVLPAAKVKAVDAEAAPDSAYLGVLGMPGLTAYVGLTRIAGFQAGDTVFVSGAAGAVGSAVGQIAKALGAKRVIGAAGSAAKVARLKELGFDAAFDYTSGGVRQLLAEAAPEGIDVFFDNVGGDQLQAAIEAFNDDGRAALCGAIAHYNATDTLPGPDNMTQIVTKRLRLQGFIVGDHLDATEEWLSHAVGWLQDGSLRFDETVREGLENAPQAFMDLLEGANTGKMVVRLR